MKQFEFIRSGNSIRDLSDGHTDKVQEIDFIDQMKLVNDFSLFSHQYVPVQTSKTVLSALCVIYKIFRYHPVRFLFRVGQRHFLLYNM